MPDISTYEEPPDSPPEDRRVRRSRRALHAALVALSGEKGYDTLTVDDLTTHADMARRTFYAHYDGKDDLLRSVVNELVGDLTHRLAEISSPAGHPIGDAVVKEMFAHGESHVAAYRMVLAGAGNGIGLRMLSNTLSDAVEAAYVQHADRVGVQPRLPLDFVARSFVGQHLTLMRWWLDHQNDYSLDQMTAMRLDIYQHGEVWALGLDHVEASIHRA